jgi:hypothetical protein
MQGHEAVGGVDVLLIHVGCVEWHLMHLHVLMSSCSGGIHQEAGGARGGCHGQARNLHRRSIGVTGIVYRIRPSDARMSMPQGWSDAT